MATVTINRRDIEIGDQERLNLIQAAQRAGIEIPHYCWHPDLTVVASCRMCLVEVGEKKPDGTVAMQAKVVPGCQTPARNGTVIVTDSKKVKDAQADTLEYLLLNHPLDCPVCDQAGECLLQDFSYRYGHAESRLKDDKLIKPDKDHIGEQIALFTDRCVMCSRCVRFTREVSGTSELLILNRGDHSEIDIFPGQPCDNKLAGNVVDICPVEALCSKDFLYKQRVWFLQSAKSVCPHCSTGCSINVDHNKGVVYRLKPRFNPKAQGHFMCDEGRFGYKYVNDDERLLRPMVRSDGHLIPVSWDAIIPTLKRELSERARTEAKSMAMVISPWATCEEAYLLAVYFKSLSPDARLALGPVRQGGDDDSYPKGPHGESPSPDKTRFTIRAEKCPNRRGVEMVLRQFQTHLILFDEILQDVRSGMIRTLFIVSCDPNPWITAEQAESLKKLDLLVVEDVLPSLAGGLAKYVLPGGTFAEKDGTFVNHAGLAQSIRRAIASPGESRTDGRIAMELLERRGLFHAPSLRREMAKEIAAFAPMADGDLGDFGVMLDQHAIY